MWYMYLDSGNSQYASKELVLSNVIEDPLPNALTKNEVTNFDHVCKKDLYLKNDLYFKVINSFQQSHDS